MPTGINTAIAVGRRPTAKGRREMVSATVADVEKSFTLPDSLRLIVLGEILTATQWMLSIEGQVVVNPHPNFVAGFAALFASCIFNLVYQHEASCTLEFIQR
ncbi:hypothetical protein ROHU_006550 [Labeo rohita]|uniref:Uncharacterized protein n=1 Tax=Labeo rohita TaxID=84645 RepID=A0A498MTZ9_LABRO|nr:hypothetical protein ROHU_006550 [Labeo rohita]